MVLYCISLQDALRAKNGDLSAFLARVKQQLDNDKDTESSKNIINLEELHLPLYEQQRAQREGTTGTCYCNHFAIHG